MNRKMKSLAVLSALTAVVALGSGCAARGQDAGREVVQEVGNDITVLDNPESLSYEQTPASAIVRIDDVRGTDWLSDEAIIVSRENKDVSPVPAEGTTWYPSKLYVRTLDSGKETPLIGGGSNDNQGYALLSPNRAYLFYKTFDLQSNTGKGYILDMATSQSRSFTGADAMELQNGLWVDNDSLLYSELTGAVNEVSVDHDGALDSKLLLQTRSPFLNNLAYIGNRLYFSNGSGLLLVHDFRSENTAVALLKNVVWMTPSPDGSQLAVVRRVKSGAMELVVTDVKGNVLQTLAQDFQIYGVAWSPDGSRIAYSGLTENGTARGVYLADVAAGSSSELQVDVKFISDPLRFSPSGDRLLISTTVPDENRGVNRFVTYLVAVKQQA
ncbi:PD40 domain-containing protein [Cohnella faecalis]|uniref:Lipoprotein LpqB beta-propeller domain-containing protein n=1 Tax=Cohnella faecalis TaxID=2315694 RepID=A0A398CKH6_9BACL|nr:PD40 domain-containing protein [Cohnella faecalis]RIE02800.1 hypothetical protein D3H35_19385 [Cohnella faecalis]